MAVLLPGCVQPTRGISGCCHSVTFRHVHTGNASDRYSFFPLAIVRWRALPEGAVASSGLGSFRAAVGGCGAPGTGHVDACFWSGFVLDPSRCPVPVFCGLVRPGRLFLCLTSLSITILTCHLFVDSLSCFYFVLFHNTMHRPCQKWA